MSVPSQSAVFSIAKQDGKIGDGVIDTNSLDWYRTRAPRIGVGVVQDQDTFPLETGGPIVPTGAYKMGQYAMGSVELIPRMASFLGLVLRLGLGNVTSQEDAIWNTSTDSFDTGGSISGVNAHRFLFDPNRSFYLPWFAYRKSIPGATNADTYGEVTQDCKISGISLNIPAAGLLGMTVDIQGRKSHFPLSAEVNAWTYANQTEDALSAVHAGKGSFLVGGEKVPVTQASIELTNGLTQPQQEMVVGDPHPDDYVPLNRAMQIRIVYKWENPEFYRKILTGAVSERDWDFIPFTQDTAGGSKAFEATFQSPGAIPGATDAAGDPVPYELKVIANRVVWQLDRGGIELQAGSIIQVPYVGTVLEPADGEEYLEVIVHNDADPALYRIAGEIAPVIGLSAAGAVSYSGTDVALDSSVTVTDTDSTDFENGELRIVLGGNDFDAALDELSVDGVTVTLANNEISVSGTAVGETAFQDGDTQLVATLNANATPTTIETLLQNVFYGTSNDTNRSSEEVTATVTLDDGDGGVTTETFTITHSV